MLAEHLLGVGDLAEIFAGVFSCGQLARALAMAHDLGKYSPEFQRRILGAKISVDHSSAGAQHIYDINDKNGLGIIAAYCAAGHHTGLPDGGSKSQPLSLPGTLYARLSQPVPDYSAHKSEIELNKSGPPGVMPKEGFGVAFLTRMLYSCLVDADFLDTERFMRGAPRAEMGGSIDELKNKLTEHIADFMNPEKDINKKRTALLKAMIDAAPAAPGLFSLTAPTGSGKTISSMAFALGHAARHGMRRVIFVVPYNTIIEQNAAVYEDIFGLERVLQHHSGVNYSNDENSPDYARLLATENWDAPIVVTSSVQFFESLFANRSSACRKLHNIAGSVIVFDEAQMLPPQYIIPCVRAIRELVQSYNCSAVLATATQSSLDRFFAPLKITELAPEPQRLYEDFRRVEYRILDEPFDLDGLAARLTRHERVLCVVNTRRAAQRLAGLTGAIHLSTTMYPAHRSRALDEIRRRLENDEVCRVVSTSMVEAGVDLNFPAVYRQRAGLDSIIQAGGRCNREGRNDRAESLVYVFELEGAANRGIAMNIAAYDHVARKYEDIAGLDAIRDYFDQLFYIKGDGALGAGVVEAFDDGRKNALSFPFRSVAESFRIIPDATRTVYVPGEWRELEGRLRSGERGRQILRELQKYSVSLYEHELRAINQFEVLDENVILYLGEYDDNIGIDLEPRGGAAHII